MNSWLQVIKGANTCLYFARNLLPLFLEKWPLPVFFWPCTSLRCFLSLGICPVTFPNRTCQRLVVGLHVFVAPVPCWESLLACPQTAMPRNRLAFSGGIVPIPGKVAHLLRMVYHCFSKVCLEIAALKWTLHRSTELQRVIEGRKSP